MSVRTRVINIVGSRPNLPQIAPLIRECNVIQRSSPYSSTLVNVTTKTSRTSSFVKWALPNRTLILESVPVLTHSKLRKSLNALSPSSSNSSPISSLWLGTTSLGSAVPGGVICQVFTNCVGPRSAAAIRCSSKHVKRLRCAM